MLTNDAEYFTYRALSEMRTASAALDEDIACVHLRLSGLLLQHAGMLVSGTISATAPPARIRLVSSIPA